MVILMARLGASPLCMFMFRAVTKVLLSRHYREVLELDKVHYGTQLSQLRAVSMGVDVDSPLVSYAAYSASTPASLPSNTQTFAGATLHPSSIKPVPLSRASSSTPSRPLPNSLTGSVQALYPSALTRPSSVVHPSTSYASSPHSGDDQSGSRSPQPGALSNTGTITPFAPPAAPKLPNVHSLSTSLSPQLRGHTPGPSRAGILYAPCFDVQSYNVHAEDHSSYTSSSPSYSNVPSSSLQWMTGAFHGS